MNRRKINWFFSPPIGATRREWFLYRLYVVACIAVMAYLLIEHACAGLIETAQGPHISMYQFTIQSDAGTTTTRQPETGVAIRRITDAEALKIKYPNIKISTGVNYAGLTNGYARFENCSPDGKRALAFGTTPYAILYDLAAFKDQHFIASKFVNVGKAGDLQELKWNPADGKLYYASGHCEYRQDPVTGADELVYDYGRGYFHTSDGSFSTDGRLLAMALIDGFTTKGVTIVNDVVVIDMVARQQICKVHYGRQPDGVDISPNGKYLKIDNYFYDIPSGAYRNHNEAGHGGWSGKWFVNQNTKTDWIEAFDPETSQTLFLMRMGAWAGMHAASDKREYFHGHTLISTYKSTDSDPLGNNVFFLELKSQKPDCPVHPSKFRGTAAQATAYLKLWNSENAPVQMVRVCLMQHRYISQQYFTEGWASVGADHCIYWGGNWHATDNLELYRAELPADVQASAGFVAVTPTPVPVIHRVELYAGCNVPEWGIANYEIGPNGFQQNFMCAINNAFGYTTRGDYIVMGSGRTDTWTWQGKTITSATLVKEGGFNFPQLMYWNLSKISKSLIVARAYIGLKTGYAEFGNHPTGNEQVPILRIKNPMHYPAIWSCAHIRPNPTLNPDGTVAKIEANWNGASFGNWYEDGPIGAAYYYFMPGRTKIGYGPGKAPWNLLDTGSPHPRYGTGYARYGHIADNINASSGSLQTIAGDPTISFNPDTTEYGYSTELTALVQDWISHPENNYGIYFDADNARGTVYFGTNVNPRPVSRCYAGTTTAYKAEADRPRLILEF